MAEQTNEPVEPGDISAASEAVPEGDQAQVETPAEELIEDQWRKGAWNELEMLTCIHCQWDTLEGIDAAHARKATCPRCKPPEPPAAPPTVLVADRWGNPV